MVDLRHGCWLGLGVALVLAGCEPQASIPQGVQVYFSPRGGATGAVVNALDHATNSVLVQAYSFTSAPIAKALVDAHRRGVKVRVILDDSQRTEKYSEADFLRNNGIATLIDARHGIAHNKVMIIDDYLVITGSFNFTKAAEEHNAENLLVINDVALARQYVGNWHAHEEHSEAYERAGKPAVRKSEARKPKTEGIPKSETRTNVQAVIR
jgi:phosphatidylserine/phosphatidylglycerophosphate/cardiolipin synthase-like enzyme